MSNNKDLLKKIATGDMSAGGLMNAKQAKKFFTTTVDESVLKNSVRTVFMKEPIQEINKMNIGARVAKAKVEGTANAGTDFVGVTTSALTLSTSAIVVPFEVNQEVYEDNIEKEGFEDSLIRDISSQLSNDLEELYLLGDTATVGDAYLALFNGWLKLMTTGGNLVTVVGTVLNKAMFSTVLKGLPTKYRRNRKQLKFFVNPNDEQSYRDELTTRNTGLGDQSLVGNDNLSIFGIEVVPVPFIAQGNIILTHYQNLIIGIHSKIRLARHEDIFANTKQYAIHMRTGVQIENTEAIAYATF